MPSSHSVCLLGFSDFERRALALQFRLAAGRTPAYALVATLSEARFLVVDGDTKSAVQRALDAGRLAHCIFVGVSAAPKGALARLRRPIDALSLLRELDAAVIQLQGPTAALAPQPAPAPAPAAVAVAPVAPLRITPRPPPRPPAASPRADSLLDSQFSELAERFPDRASSNGASAADQSALARCDALLVDDSEIALKFLELKLGELGLRSRGVTDSDAALAQLESHDFNYVFLDVELGPGSRLDGLALCRHIKRRTKRPPVVAMVSAHASQTDRVRGSLAGCDAYLGKPLRPSDLLTVVGLRRGR
ncbi:MAG TPA: response regulator [Burkholderiaceae bacterium]|nr:response regulator [Burkholderiaceae bacterium]